MKNDCKYSTVRDIVDGWEFCLLGYDNCPNDKCHHFAQDNEVTTLIKKKIPFITLEQYRAIITLFGSFLSDDLSEEKVRIFKTFFDLYFGEEMA